MVTSAAVVAGALYLLERRVLSGIEPSPDDDPCHERDSRPKASSIRTRRISTPDGGELYSEERGEGPPILLLHGHGATLGTFGTLAPRLVADGHRVIAVDLRGFGRSSAIPDRFDFVGLVDDVATVLDTLDLRETIVVGHSMGGAIALGLSIHRREIVGKRVGGLVVLNGTGRGPSDTRVNRARVTAMEWSWWERLGRHPRHGVVLARGNFGVAPRRSDVEAARLLGLDSPIAARRGFARRLLGTDLTSRLETVGVPVLVVGGSADRVIPASESTLLGELLPDVRVEILDGAGHMLPMERASTVAELIRDFRDELGRKK